MNAVFTSVGCTLSNAYSMSERSAELNKPNSIVSLLVRAVKNKVESELGDMVHVKLFSILSSYSAFIGDFLRDDFVCGLRSKCST